MTFSKSHLSVLLVFASGIILGVAISQFCSHPECGLPPGPPRPPTKQMFLDRLAHELQLQPQQVKAIKAPVFELDDQLNTLRKTVDPQIQAAFEAAAQKIEPSLTDEQKGRLKDLLKHVLPGPPMGPPHGPPHWDHDGPPPGDDFHRDDGPPTHGE